MSSQNGPFVVVALCRGGCRFFAVCFKLYISTFTLKTNEKPTKNDALGSLWWSGSSFCPRRAVRIGFSHLIRSCRYRFVFYSQSLGQGGCRHDILGSLWRPGSSSCPRRAVRIGFGSIICLFCVLPSIPLSVKVYACYRLDSSGINWADLGSSGLIWAHLGSSGLTWAHLSSSGLSGLLWGLWAHLGSAGLICAHLASSRLVWAHLGSSALIWAHMVSGAASGDPVVRYSRMWCPHDIGRDSWVWGEQGTLEMMNSPHELGDEAFVERRPLSGGNGVALG